MCMGGSAPKPQPAPPPPAPPAPPAPPTTMAPADGSNRRTDSSALMANRGRASLRIDRTAPNTGSSGGGLNIPS